MSEAATRAHPGVRFGDFEFRRSERLLLRAGEPVSLGGRAFDLLAALIEQREGVVSQRTLMERVWPGLHVEETALRFHISQLRKALGPEGARYVLNIPGRGYSFVAPATDVAPQPSASERAACAPPPPRGMVGREVALSNAMEALRAHRFVTLTGPGGIGKTTLATALLHEIREEFDVVGFVDLSVLHDPRLVAGSVASSLGLPVTSQAVAATVQAFLQDKKGLLFVDNCEHVIEPTAALLEQLFLSAAELSLIATSREPLQVTGERVIAVPSLACPPAAEGLAAAELLDFPAARHFIARVRQAGGFAGEVSEADAAAVASICRDLDGVPLALEIAAGVVGAYGLGETAAMLDGQLKLAWRGRRTAAPRQQTLRGTLDWSYGLIPEPDRALLRRLAVFPGEFPLDAAQAVAGVGALNTADVFLTPADVVARLPELVAKSLISADTSGPRPRYRLLLTTRAYVQAKLREAGEDQVIARRHADYVLDCFRTAEQEANGRPVADWLAEYRPRLDDLRTALDWAMRPEGDGELGASLTAAAAPLFTSLSLMNEFQARAELALSRCSVEVEAGGEREMRIYAALANVLVNTQGPSPAAAEACAKTLTIAERIGDLDYQMRALLALWNDCYSNGQIRKALDFAQKFSRAAHAAESRGDILMGHRLLGVTQYVLGQADHARVNLETTVEGYATAITESHMARFAFDQQASTRGLLGSVLLYLGHAEAGLKAIRQSVAEAIASGHALTVCGVLGTTSCTAALYAGDLESAAEWAERLGRTAEQYGYASWITMAKAIEGLLALRRGKTDEGVAILGNALASVDRSNARYHLMFCEHAHALAEVGELAAGEALLDDTLARAQASQQIWYLPEYLRYKALLSRRSAPEKAEPLFASALSKAEALGARVWALRAATDLAALRHEAGRTAEARQTLLPVVAALNDSYEIEDLRRARRVLTSLA